MDFHPELASAGFPSDLTLLTKHYRAEFDAFTQASCDGGHGFGYGSQDNTFLTLLDGTDLAGDGNDALEDDSCDEMDIFLSPPKGELKHPTWVDNDDSESEEEPSSRRSGRAVTRGVSVASAITKPSHAHASQGDDGKDRSLGLLCERFLREYGCAGQCELSLDEAADKLCVERRRIYDIVNIFESLEIMKRKGKNKYLWLGTPKLPATLDMLRNRAVGVRMERISRMGADPRPDCCIRLDGVSASSPCSRDGLGSPSRITADLSTCTGDSGSSVKCGGGSGGVDSGVVLTQQVKLCLPPALPPTTTLVSSSTTTVTTTDPSELPSPMRARRSPFRVTVTNLSSPPRPTAAELRRQNSSTPAPSPRAGTTANVSTHTPTPSNNSNANANGCIVSEDLACSAPTRTIVPRREKSLGTLCQKFLSIFLLGKVSFCLDDAAKLLMLPDEATGPGKLRTKIRRLYDIANVLCTLGLIEKVHASSQKKPGFHWRGAQAAQSFIDSLKRRRVGGTSVEPPAKRSS